MVDSLNQKEKKVSSDVISSRVITVSVLSINCNQKSTFLLLWFKISYIGCNICSGFIVISIFQESFIKFIIYFYTPHTHTTSPGGSRNIYIFSRCRYIARRGLSHDAWCVSDLRSGAFRVFYPSLLVFWFSRFPFDSSRDEYEYRHR